MKRLIFVAALLIASPLYAQCPLGGCQRSYTGFGYSRVTPTYRASTGFYGAFQTVQPCQAVETVAPCQAVETVEACAPVETVEPCAPVETVEPCSPVATCNEYTPSIVEGKVSVGQCVGGACPLRTTAKVATTTVANTLKGVASLLDRVNQTRARYGLAALQVADLGAQRQASVCATTGTLQHGAGYAEILAQNGQGLETAIQQWLNSPGHRALLLNGSYRYADVGVVRSGGRVWCAVRFK